MGIVAAMNLTALLWPGATTVQDKINNQVTLQKIFKVPNEFFQFLSSNAFHEMEYEYVKITASEGWNLDQCCQTIKFL